MKNWNAVFYIKMSSVLNLSFFCLEINLVPSERPQKSKSDRKIKTDTHKYTRYTKIYTFTDKGFFAGFITIQYCIP